ncbi:MAG TPA: methyltransferase [Gammaproteobacteria bacterium]|nr:methyltransferase [Gammaproteobacteria bacterium]
MSLAQRRREEELLDVLPASDPRAQRSRRDLRRVNVLMGQRFILRQNLQALFSASAPRRIIEIGAGDGTLMLSLARSLAGRWPGVTVTLVDRHPIVSPATLTAFSQLGWRTECVTADAIPWFQQGHPADLAVANLVLHHFDEPPLRKLFAAIARTTEVFVATEPRRSSTALMGSRALALIGCNEISRHDAVVSVRAGFNGRELSALWPAGNDWQLTERRAGLFTHLFVARQGGQLREKRRDL